MASQRVTYIGMPREENSVSFTGGGGGFFLACENFGECSTVHSLPELFFLSLSLSLFFFFEVEISSRRLISLFMPLYSGSAN